MAAELSKKDYEMINSYLDQELNPEELLHFADLAADPTVKAELEDLAKVRNMLRELPEETPPRPYFLTRSMAEEARPKPIWERLFPIFRTAAAFCALALALTFVFSLLPLSGNSTREESAPMERQTYISKSLPESFILTENEVNSSSDEQVLWFDREQTAEKAAVMPSYGVMGGSPRNEYLLRQEAQRQPERPMDTLDLVEKILAGGLILSAAGVLYLDRRRKKRAGQRI